MKVLFHLTRVFSLFEQTKFSKGKFQKLPNISNNARQNSKMILVLLALILLPEKK